MKLLAFNVIAILLLAVKTVSAEACFPLPPAGTVCETPPPDREMHSAFDASFGKRGLRSPSIVHKMTRVSVVPNDRWEHFEYDVSLFDEEAARQLSDDEQELNLARLAFSAALKREMCQNAEAIEVIQEGGFLEFGVMFRLGEPTQENGWKYLLREEVRVPIASCEAN